MFFLGKHSLMKQRNIVGPAGDGTTPISSLPRFCLSLLKFVSINFVELKRTIEFVCKNPKKFELQKSYKNYLKRVQKIQWFNNFLSNV